MHTCCRDRSSLEWSLEAGFLSKVGVSSKQGVSLLVCSQLLEGSQDCKCPACREQAALPVVSARHSGEWQDKQALPGPARGRQQWYETRTQELI